MSGHSKWATTKRAKAAVDAKRSNLFTKLSKNITVAARGGLDPNANFKLRMAIDKARDLNMPKDSIERAIKRAAGVGDGNSIESLLYEAYGPEGAALLIEVVTDNKNRAVANIKNILSKYDGNLAGAGSVLWMFDIRGAIDLGQSNLSEQAELDIIEAGALDIIHDEQIRIITELNDLEKVKNNLQSKNFLIKSSEIIYQAKNQVNLSDPDKLLRLLDALDDDDDVDNIYTNANI
ncbi:MAG: YebC/PmpR family DNA-binding transcriptional regulator [Patescibacteria group bacterium]